MLREIIFDCEKIFFKIRILLCNWTCFVRIYFKKVDEHKSDDPIFK